MSYGDRQRRDMETQERQATRDNFNMFSRVAGFKVTEADEIVSQSSGESDQDALSELTSKLEATKTGVDYVDNVISAKGQRIELRKRTVKAKTKINDHLDKLNSQLGNDNTVGATKLLGVLKSAYSNTADHFASTEKVLLNNKIIKAENHLKFRLLKGQYDIDKETEGYQLPAYMEKADKQYFNEVIKPQIEVGGESESYVSAINAMQSGFGNIRDERTRYDTSESKQRARQVVIDEKTQVKLANANRELSFNELNTHFKNTLDAYADLPGDLNGPGQNAFYETLTKVGEHTSSMTGEKLQSANIIGMLKKVDEAIMMNLKNSHRAGFGNTSYLSQYALKGDPLDKKHRRDMQLFIETNKTKNKEGGIKYGINYGEGPAGHRGMSHLINTMNKLVEMYETPGLTLQSKKLEEENPSEQTGGFGSKIRATRPVSKEEGR